MKKQELSHKSGTVGRTTKNVAKLVVFPISESAPLIHDAYGSPKDPLSLRRVAAYCKGGGYSIHSISYLLQQHLEKFKICDEVLYFDATQKSLNIFGISWPWGQNLSFVSNSIVDREDYIPATSSNAQCPPAILIFDYGVIVFWGLSEDLERALINIFEQKQFKQNNSSFLDCVQEEVLQYYIDESASTSGRVYGDVIMIRIEDFSVRLSISHALAQSVKLAVFEERLSEALDSTWRFPLQLAQTGRLPSSTSKTDVHKKIGELFILRMQLNLISNILDTPDIFWTEVQWEGLYKSARTYLEIPQRIDVLNQRMLVISDLLDMLKEHLTTLHGEFLEWIFDLRNEQPIITRVGSSANFRMNALFTTRLALVLMALILIIPVMVENTTIKGKFMLDRVDGPVYNNLLYDNGIITLSGPSTDEISWRVVAEPGKNTVNGVPSPTESSTSPKGSKLWRIALGAPNSPTHMLYSSSLQALQELQNGLLYVPFTKPDSSFGESMFQNTPHYISPDVETDPQTLLNLVLYEIEKIFSLPESRKIERELLMKLMKHFCPPILSDFLG